MIPLAPLTSYGLNCVPLLWATPALSGTALTKSLPTMNTGSLNYLSLSPGLVVPYEINYQKYAYS